MWQSNAAGEAHRGNDNAGNASHGPAAVLQLGIAVPAAVSGSKQCHHGSRALEQWTKQARAARCAPVEGLLVDTQVQGVCRRGTRHTDCSMNNCATHTARRLSQTHPTRRTEAKVARQSAVKVRGRGGAWLPERARAGLHHNSRATGLQEAAAATAGQVWWGELHALQATIRLQIARKSPYSATAWPAHLHTGGGPAQGDPAGERGLHRVQLAKWRRSSGGRQPTVRARSPEKGWRLRSVWVKRDDKRRHGAGAHRSVVPSPCRASRTLFARSPSTAEQRVEQRLDLLAAQVQTVHPLRASVACGWEVEWGAVSWASPVGRRQAKPG